MTMLYTSEQMGRIHDRLNNARQLIQFARCDEPRRGSLIEETHRMLGELAEALKDGFVELSTEEVVETADECYTIEDEILEAMNRG